MIFNTPRKVKFLCALSSVVFLSACSTRTNQLTTSELNARVDSTKQKLFAAQPDFVLNQEITLGEAMGRSLLYNLDDRVKQMEIAIESGQLDVEKVNLLPKLLVNAGYSRRSNDSSFFSTNLVTGRDGDSFNSSNKDVRTANMEFSWDILDLAAGIASVGVQRSKLEEARIKKEQAIERIIRDVRHSYWRALASTEVINRINSLNRSIENQLVDINRSLSSVSSEQAISLLRNKRNLLDTQREVSELDRSANNVVQELNALINIKPGVSFKVKRPKVTALNPLRLNSSSVEKLEDFMFRNIHELYLSDYDVLITSQEAKRDLLRLIPSIKPNLTAHYNSNSFLLNSTYYSWGINFAFDLFKLVKYPSVKRFGEAKIEASESARRALMINMLAEMHIAIDRYNNLLSSYSFSYNLANTHKKLLISKKREGEVGLSSQVELIDIELKSLKSQYDRALMFADLQDAKSNLYKSLGLYPINKSVSSHDLDSLSVELGKRDNEMSDPREVLKGIIANKQL